MNWCHGNVGEGSGSLLHRWAFHWEATEFQLNDLGTACKRVFALLGWVVNYDIVIVVFGFRVGATSRQVLFGGIVPLVEDGAFLRYGQSGGGVDTECVGNVVG